MLDKLEYLLALARERNFGRAAETCGVTQPTFSAGIKQLEDTLGVMLVQRTSRFLGFTAEGERVLDWARTIVADARAMRAEVQTLKKGLAGHLRIAAIPTALPMVSALTTPYRAKHPNVKFTILSRTSIDILQMVENLEVDAGLTYIDNEPLGRLRAVPLYNEQYRLLTSADSPLGDHDRVTWAEVGKIPLCLLTPDMQNRRIIDGLLHAAGTRARADPRIELDDRAVLPCPHRPLGQRHARAPGRYAGPHRAAAVDPDRRARGRAPDRPCCSATRTDDADGRGSGCRSQPIGRRHTGRLDHFDREGLSFHRMALMQALCPGRIIGSGVRGAAAPDALRLKMRRRFECPKDHGQPISHAILARAAVAAARCRRAGRSSRRPRTTSGPCWATPRAGATC